MGSLPTRCFQLFFIFENRQTVAISFWLSWQSRNFTTAGGFYLTSHEVIFHVKLVLAAFWAALEQIRIVFAHDIFEFPLCTHAHWMKSVSNVHFPYSFSFNGSETFLGVHHSALLVEFHLSLLHRVDFQFSLCCARLGFISFRLAYLFRLSLFCRVQVVWTSSSNLARRTLYTVMMLAKCAILIAKRRAGRGTRRTF